MALNANIPLGAKVAQAPNLLQMMKQAGQVREQQANRKVRRRGDDYRQNLGDLMGQGQNATQANQSLTGQYPMLAQSGLRQAQSDQNTQDMANRKQQEYNLQVIGPTVSEWNKLPLMEKQKMHSRNVQGLISRGVKLDEWFKSPKYTPEHERYLQQTGQQWQQQNAIKGGGQYSKNPFYYTDKEGNTKIGQLSGKGGMETVQLPEGSTIPEGVSVMNLKDRQDVIGKKTGKLIRSEKQGIGPATQIDIAQKWAKIGYDKDLLDIRTKEAGLKTQELQAKIDSGKADKIDAYDTYRDKTLSGVKAIDDMIGNTSKGVKRHKGLSGAVGAKNWSSGFGLRETPAGGTKERDFYSIYKKISGEAFLQAFASIKGGGHITEVEGEKATQAITDMNTAQSEPAFIASAKEFRSILEKGLKRARKKYLTQTKGSADNKPEKKQTDLRKKYRY